MPLENENTDQLAEEGKQEDQQQQQEGQQAEGQQAEGEQEPQYTEIELQAMEQGWVPLDKWTGKKEEHRSAREFVDRGELLAKIRSQSGQMQELKGMIQHLSEHNKKVYEKGYEKAIADLKRDRAVAIKEGDVELVEAIDQQIDEHKEAQQSLKAVPAQPQQQVSATTQAWLQRNTWYNRDPVMRGAVNMLAFEFGRVNPGISEEEIYAYIDKEVRKEFPHKFQGQPSPQRKQGAPSPEGQGSRTNGSGNKGGQKSVDAEFNELISEFDEFDAQVARNLVKSGVITKEKYVEDYKKLGGR